MNRVTAACVGYPFMFMLIAVASLEVSGKAAMSILLFGITLVVFLLAHLKKLKIAAIISGLLAATLACAMFAIVDYNARNGYVENAEYQSHLIGTVVEEPDFNGEYLYLIKSDDGKLIRLYSKSIGDGKLYDSFEGDVTLALRENVTDGAHFSAYADDESSFRFYESGKFGVKGVLSAIRKWSAGKIDEISRDGTSEFLKGIMLGEDGAISNELYKSFKATGLTHVLVISGSHLNIIMLVITSFLTLLRGSRRRYYIIAMMAIFAYMALVGFGASVVRSGICFLVIGVGFISSRDSDPVNSLGAAALITGIIDPYTVINLGFQLSFFAAFGIVTVGAYLIRKIKYGRLPRILRALLSLATITFVAQLFTLPVLVPIYSSISLVSLIANMLISFAVDIAAVLALIYLVLSATYILYPIALIFGNLSSLFASHCVAVANNLTDNPISYIEVPQMSFAITVLVAFSALAILILKGNRCIKSVAAVICLAIVLLCVSTVFYNDCIRITAVCDGAYIISYKGNAVIAGCGRNKYEAGKLSYACAETVGVDISLIVAEDDYRDALITALAEIDADAVMAPSLNRIKRLYPNSFDLFESGSITPFEDCRVTDTEDYTLISIKGVNIAVADKYGHVPPEVRADILLCTEGVKGIAKAAIIMPDTKPLALKANKVYNAYSDEFVLSVSKYGSIVAVE